MKDVRNRKKRKIAEITDNMKEIVITIKNSSTYISANKDGTLNVVNK